MKRELVDILICPECKESNLTLTAVTSESEYVASGNLLCAKCKATYMIKNQIPYLISSRMQDSILNQDKLASLHTDTRTLEAEELDAVVKVANANYYNRAAGNYENDVAAKCLFETEHGSQVRIKEVISLIRRNVEGDVFLDIGCGTGNMMLQARQQFKNTIGVDISIKMLEICRKKGLDVLLADAGSLPFETESVDAVSCFSVLHHFYNWSDYLPEFFRVLKKGGYFYTDWDPNTISALLKLCYRIYRSDRPWIRKLVHRKTSSFKRSDVETYSLAKLAEYHHHYSSGINPSRLRERLSNLGFEEVKIILHNNSDTINKIALTPKDYIWSLLNFSLNPRSKLRYILSLSKK